MADEHCQDSMNMTAESLRKGDDDIANISVSVDGNWQKRYGHKSLLGASFVISTENGQVLDCVIRCKSCQIYNHNPNASKEWKRKHKSVCKINHTTSVGAMEKEDIVEMFVNSTQERKLKYVEYVGDGDKNSFAAVH